MKKHIVIGLLFFYSSSFAQKPYYGFFIGPNLSAIGLDLRTAGANRLTYNTFKDSKIGFNIGYKYIMPLSPAVSISAGIEFKNLNCKFERPYYNDPNWITQNLTSVYEYIKLSRVSIPIQGYYNFANKGKSSFYFTTGVDIIFFNNVKRKVNYSLPGPPTGLVELTYEGKQKIKFNTDNQLGLTIFGGIGSEFSIREKYFVVELSFCDDISKNKFLTLHNIEGDSYFYSKFKSFQLKFGHTFSLDFKKNKQ